MPRYATIDLNSGFVWWLGYADDPEEACRMSPEGNDHPVTEAGVYKRISPSQAKDTGGGYAVYEIPPDFDIDDGQDRADIAKVEAQRFVGLYRWRDDG